MAWPLNSWKNLAATVFLVALKGALILGRASPVGLSKAPLPFLSFILAAVLLIHCLVTLSVALLPKKARLSLPRVPLRGGELAASFAAWSALSFPSTPTCAGVHLIVTVLSLWYSR